MSEEVDTNVSGRAKEASSRPGKVVVGREEVGWGQLLRVTLHTTTK